jgi:subtilase family serine protease
MHQRARKLRALLCVATATATATTLTAAVATAATTARAHRPTSAIVVLPTSHPAALAELAHRISTPSASSYRDFLTVTAAEHEFAPSAREIQTVEARLRHAGLKVTHATGPAITVTGTSQALHALQGNVQATTKVARAKAIPSGPQRPFETTNLIVVKKVRLGSVSLRSSRSIGHSNSSGLLSPNTSDGGPQPCATISEIASEEHEGYTPDQVAAAYGLGSLYSSGGLGAGQTIGVLELEPDLPSDISAWESCYGVSTAVNYEEIDGGIDGNGTTGAGSTGEAALDIEQLVALAPDATIDVYQAPNTAQGVLDAYQAMVDNQSINVISTSWGLCESNTSDAFVAAENTLFEQAAVEGQTVLAAAGDRGSSDCATSALAVDDPAAQPYVTGVGATTLNSLTDLSAQTVWNDSSTTDGASGGGVSSFWPMPSWQDAAAYHAGSAPCGVAACREVPDVAADGDPKTGYWFYHTSGGYLGAALFGGTSTDAPFWAAMIADINSTTWCNGHPIGFANPLLYTAATGTGTDPTITDITTGDNAYTPDGYAGSSWSAASGYDLASGLGTPLAGSLGLALCQATDYVTLTAPPTQTTSAGSIVSLNPTAADSDDHALTWAASGLPAGLSINPTTGTISGTPTTAGSYTVVLTATAAADGVTKTISFSWTISQEADSLALTAPANQTAIVENAVTPVGGIATDGYGYAVTWAASGLPAGLSINPSTGVISGTPTTAGAYTVTLIATAAHDLLSRTTIFLWTVSPAVTNDSGSSSGPGSNPAAGSSPTTTLPTGENSQSGAAGSGETGSSSSGATSHRGTGKHLPNKHKHKARKHRKRKHAPRKHAKHSKRREKSA